MTLAPARQQRYFQGGGGGHSQDDEHTSYTLGQVNLFRRLTFSGRE